MDSRKYMDRGALYYATGEEYLEEAVRSVRSLKRHMPGLPVAVVTDQEDVPEIFDTATVIEPTDRHPFLDRIQYQAESPYDRTLYLDTDTYVTADVGELFELLDRFDFAAALSPIRRRMPMEVPEGFVEFNTGVIVHKRTESVRNMFFRFEELYEQYMEERGKFNNEPFLRQALYEHDVNICTLPDEYNCRFFGPTFLNDTVKILHGQHPDMAAMAEMVNKETSKRVLTGHSDRRMFAEPKPMSVYRYPGPSKYRIYWDRVKRSRRENGVRETVQLLRERARRLF